MWKLLNIAPRDVFYMKYVTVESKYFRRVFFRLFMSDFWLQLKWVKLINKQIGVNDCYLKIVFIIAYLLHTQYMKTTGEKLGQSIFS